jgi:hypothetical protein
MVSNNKDIKWVVNGNFLIKHENPQDKVQQSCQFESRNNDKIKDIRIGIFTNGDACLIVSFCSASNVNNFKKLFRPLKDKFKNNVHTLHLTSSNLIDIATFLQALIKFDVNVKVISPVIFECFNINITQNMEINQRYEGELKINNEEPKEGKFDLTVSDSMKAFIKLTLFTMIELNKLSPEPINLDELNLNKFFQNYQNKIKPGLNTKA